MRSIWAATTRKYYRVRTTRVHEFIEMYCGLVPNVRSYSQYLPGTIQYQPELVCRRMGKIYRKLAPTLIAYINSQVGELHRMTRFPLHRSYSQYLPGTMLTQPVSSRDTIQYQPELVRRRMGKINEGLSCVIHDN